MTYFFYSLPTFTWLPNIKRIDKIKTRSLNSSQRPNCRETPESHRPLGPRASPPHRPQVHRSRYIKAQYYSNLFQNFIFRTYYWTLSIFNNSFCNSLHIMSTSQHYSLIRPYFLEIKYDLQRKLFTKCFFFRFYFSEMYN